jgi:ubiquinol oxidase
LLPLPVQNHAVDTYAEFVEQNAELLKSMPPPLVALNYYKAGDLYLFDAFQANWDSKGARRPACK